MKNAFLKNLKIVLIIFIFLIIVSLMGQAQQEVLNKDCSINWEVFNRDWKKYSDVDERFTFAELNLRERSWETQKYYTTQETIVDLKLQIYFLKRDMAIDAEMRKDLRVLKKGLVGTLRANLLKSFWRLAWNTYDTIKTGQGLGKSYVKLFSAAGAIPKIGASLKLLKGLTPKDSKLAINTKDTTGKIKAISVSGALEAMESLADPMATGTAICNEMGKQFLPKAELSKEEIKILYKQNWNNRLMTQALEESYRMNGERQKELQRLEEEVQKLEEELINWEAEEKKRVADMLVFNCKKNLKTDKKEEEPAGEDKVIQYTELECPVAPSGFVYISPEEGGRNLTDLFDPSSFFGIEPDSICAYYLRNIAPEFPYYVSDHIETILLLWQFKSADEAKEELTILFSKARDEIEEDTSQIILENSENRLVMEHNERMEETWYEGSIEKNYSYERSMYIMYGFVLYKKYILFIRIAGDIPTSVEAKAITTSKVAFSELEENTKILLESGK